jgi:uncharacterized C2H2 Zn-finger protein
MKTENGTSAFSRWSEGYCIYHCSMCDVDFKCSLKFWKHVKRAHDMDMGAYQVKVNFKKEYKYEVPRPSHIRAFFWN